MAKINKNFISFVVLGSPNPQILNVDFLKDNKIVPVDESPFDKLFQREKPLTKFLSTPVVSNLVLENIDFLVDEQRFQIRDTVISEWTETKIFEIATKYFAVLRYTPMKVVGFNFNATIAFESPKETTNFQELFLDKNSGILSLISKDNIDASLVLKYPYSNSGGRIALTVSQFDKANNTRSVNFNYEFDFSDWEKFKAELEKMPEVAGYFDSILAKLIKAI